MWLAPKLTTKKPDQSKTPFYLHKPLQSRAVLSAANLDDVTPAGVSKEDVNGVSTTLHQRTPIN